MTNFTAHVAVRHALFGDGVEHLAIRTSERVVAPFITAEAQVVLVTMEGVVGQGPEGRAIVRAVYFARLQRSHRARGLNQNENGPDGS